ncbi:MAG: ATP-dependent DNA helicase RecG [Chloroflexi bacterium]|nr:ATP-dependent DNA helicase RecG [Chloroflexota bacterium]
MLKSIEKLRKYFRLEDKRGYDDESVMGGLRSILSTWEGEARADGLPESIIQAVSSRLRDYHRLSEKSRKVSLVGLWRRIKREPSIAAALAEEETRPGFSAAPEEPPAQEPSAEPEDDSPQEEVTAPQVATPEEEDAAPAESASPQEESPKPAISPPSQPAPTPKEAQPSPAPTPKVDMQAPLTEISGIGPKRAEALENLGMTTVGDVLYNFPRRHDDYSKLKPIRDLEYGESVTVIGTVKKASTRTVRSGKMQLAEAVISDKSGPLRVTWFNQPWVARQLLRAKQVVLSGEVDQYLGRLTMNNPEWEELDEILLHTNRIAPVYPLTQGIGQRWMRGIAHKAIKNYAPYVEDPLPQALLEEASLIPLSEALVNIHFPESEENLKAAQHRLAFDEIFTLQLGVLHQKQVWQGKRGRVFKSPNFWLAPQLSRLPFTLTEAQKKALSDVRNDLISGHPMNRLLQGDVGSGKTVVAAMAMLIVTRHGAQAALMAPTSILAEQHFESMREVLIGTGSELAKDEVRLLVGATPAAEKEAIREGLVKGEIKVLIGTHALLEETVKFKDLQLIVIDEQHRFGVNQRGTLRQKGENLHLMVMTATPIPRSLALTVYGDLDVSIIDEMPPGRQPVDTYILYPKERERAYSLIRAQVEKGNQAFIIYPLVEESDKLQEKAAVEEHARLQADVFSQYELGLLHGRLPENEKEEVMAKFRDGETQILVSTSVVEVGVDIPQATVMLIEGAHRFGLAQLHQLRGRVGRGGEKAYCLLVPGGAEATENERLLAMVETNDGFKLAERDLAQRGPGQFLGTRQSGYSELQLANMTDLRLIEKARRHAQALFKNDPALSRPEHKALWERVKLIWPDENGGDIS